MEKYGLALVEFEKNKFTHKPESMREACDELKKIEDKILQRSNSNILLKLINEYKLKNLIDC